MYVCAHDNLIYMVLILVVLAAVGASDEPLTSGVFFQIGKSCWQLMTCDFEIMNNDLIGWL